MDSGTVCGLASFADFVSGVVWLLLVGFGGSSMTVEDRVIFRMPVDRELQFPAMASLQSYVNEYPERMKFQDPSSGTVTFDLSYGVVMPPEDWNMFLRAGLELRIPPTLDTHEPLASDVLIDMSDARIKAYGGARRHAGQVCAVLSGVAAPPFPKVRRVAPRMQNFRWGVFGNLAGFERVDPYILLDIENWEWTGFVGAAGWGTYLAASMGLAVVELVPEGRPREWLSKFTNTGYRVIKSWDEDMVRRAISSVEQNSLVAKK
jgi:hypothetical protein